MSNVLRFLRALADPTRMRILALLQREELSVQELQEITRMGQSRISTHLGFLQECGLLASRREGKRTFYRLASAVPEEVRDHLGLAWVGAKELPEYGEDQVNLRRILARRQDHAQVLFSQVAGRFDRSYGPGRSWQAFGQVLLRLLPPLVVADLGSGEGLLSELLALRCRRVIAVDNSEKMVAYGSAKAKQSGFKNLEFRLGDLEDPPIETGTIDAVMLSQALHHAADPLRALRGACRILRRGGQVLILDLRAHHFERATELYGDRWLGFSESQLHRWLEAAEFAEAEVHVVAREEQPPHFETILGCGRKP